MAKFYGIGTGPGNSELLTMKAVHTLEKLDVLYTPEPKKGGTSLALKIVSPYLPEKLTVKQRHFPMSYNKEEKEQAWERIAAEIKEDVLSEKNAGFITLGDPMIYSTYSYLLELLQTEVETETIAGISSFSYIASRIGWPIVMDEESLAVIPVTSGEAAVNQVLTHFHTIILMKAASNMPLVLRLLDKHQLLEKAVLVSNASMVSEKITYGLEHLHDDEKLSYFSTIIVKKER
ncbi:cobalt-factor II C(20)-methyltransferase [Paenibacillus larvae]|uniref:cobalt-factor II C(20)-methyltransferase n=1 Tax=Paenibacillus larvae TaxID=1464 RepID=UPI0023A97EAD|nr:cobalt-factor II C(20)-methyltransferase [Paenibacillus larvae]MDE5167255.1 cobalt-factor II C(20)-methyltransferase [Paenibacillus larvae subsp. larvae]